MRTRIPLKLTLSLLAGVMATGALAQLTPTAPGVWDGSSKRYNPYTTPTPPVENGQGGIEDAPVESRLQFLVKEDTKEVWYKRDNNEPDLVTRAYQIKNADPFEMLPYIKTVAQSGRFYKGNVQIIVYNDGAKFMVVSAEDYKFEKRDDGSQSIDEVIATLDLPKMTSSTGNKVGVYYPKFRPSNQLIQLIARQGLDLEGDTNELLFSKGKISFDPDLNCIVWYGGPYAIPRMLKWLNIYDRPLPQVKVEYMVYELDFENDGAIGSDWQAWKNGPGQDLFSTSYQASRGWTSMDNLNYGMTGIASANPSSNTQYVRFSPKWNTKYVDFLVVRGNARVQTTGELTIKNRMAGTIVEMTNSINLSDKAYSSANQKIVGSTILINNGAFKPATQKGNVVGDYQIVASKTSYGEGTITTSDSYSSARPTSGNKYSVSIVYLNNDYNTCTLQVMGKNEEATTGFGIIQDGVLIEEWEKECYNVKVRQWKVTDTTTGATGWVDVTASLKTAAVAANNFIYKDKITVVNSIRGDAFYLKLYPIVCQDSTTLQVEGLMSSLIGFQSNGSPRMQTSDIDTRVEINNKSSKFVIGGLQKFKSVRNTEGIPFLGQIPGLGFLLSREVEEIQKSQLVVMLECQVLTPTYFTSLVGEDGATLTNKGNDMPQVSIKDLQDLQEMPEKTTAEIVKVKEATGNIKEKGWESMTHWGFGQWGIDNETTKIEFTDIEL